MDTREKSRYDLKDHSLAVKSAALGRTINVPGKIQRQVRILPNMSGEHVKDGLVSGAIHLEHRSVMLAAALARYAAVAAKGVDAIKIAGGIADQSAIRSCSIE